MVPFVNPIAMKAIVMNTLIIAISNNLSAFESNSKHFKHNDSSMSHFSFIKFKMANFRRTRLFSVR